MPQVYVGATSREHEAAVARIRASFEHRADRMNGRHLRQVVKAYLMARGLEKVPFRAITRTEHRHGIQEHSLVLELPDFSELYSHERELTADVTAELIDDLSALLHTWFNKHEHRLVVSEHKRIFGCPEKSLVRYKDWRVELNPWFFDRS